MPEHWSRPPQGPAPPDDDGAAPAAAPPDPTAHAARAHGWRRRWRWYWRRALLVLVLAIAGLVAALLLIDLGISLSTRGAIAKTIDEVEPVEVALILGTSRSHRGKPNRFYQARIEAAAKLYHSGRVRGILVSGDNATRYYNEPISMQKDLVALGVPADYITLDYAGFRTLDSMVRAKQVFGLDHVLVVSQRFHAARAIFLARRFDLDACGFAAADPPHAGYLKIRAREVLARAAAILDIVTGRGPRFLGERETVRLRDKPLPTQTPEHPS